MGEYTLKRKGQMKDKDSHRCSASYWAECERQRGGAANAMSGMWSLGVNKDQWFACYTSRLVG